jgi:hypothetical protein
MMLKVNLPELFYERASERQAEEARLQRKARHWLTGLAIKAHIVKLREYFGRMTEADIEFLRHDANIEEAVSDMRRLSRELSDLADKLEPNDGELALLAKARGRIGEVA